MIYLDNSATTRIDEGVLESMLPWMTEKYGNASSIHGLGRAARVAIEDSRTEIAHYINAHPAELIFTSGGTESNNTVLKSCIFESELCTELASPLTEHHSVLNPNEAMEALGIPWHKIGVDASGAVSGADLAIVNRKSVLVSVMHGNNETGIVQPIGDLRKSAANAYFHTDAVQSFGKIPIDVQDLNVDFATISAHKIHGPKGIGAMFIKKGIDFKAHQQGGGQERNRRAGTEAVALIVGFAAAARKAVRDLEENCQKIVTLRDKLNYLLRNSILDIRVNTPLENTLPHILNVSFKDAEFLDGEAIIQSMDISGVAVSNGSACVSGSAQPSHVLLGMGLPPAETKAAVRFSLSKYTTESEIEQSVAILSEIIRKLRVITCN
ncbi:MAG: cysteine desulfurase [Ignavibacteria bacterium]|nr:cysteine desulfurase [Ignavibacteria bacterium]